MSTEPRPQTAPSRISPPNGSALHRAGSSIATVSMWPLRTSRGPSGGPGSTAASDGRPGIDSTRVSSAPVPSSWRSISSTMASSEHPRVDARGAHQGAERRPQGLDRELGQLGKRGQFARFGLRASDVR